jgi:hypothetical protein
MVNPAAERVGGNPPPRTAPSCSRMFALVGVVEEEESFRKQGLLSAQRADLPGETGCKRPFATGRFSSLWQRL